MGPFLRAQRTGVCSISLFGEYRYLSPMARKERWEVWKADVDGEKVGLMRLLGINVVGNRRVALVE